VLLTAAGEALGRSESLNARVPTETHSTIYPGRHR